MLNFLPKPAAMKIYDRLTDSRYTTPNVLNLIQCYAVHLTVY